MRLNVCCGARLLPGYTNIDIVATPDRRAPDILCDAADVPLPDGCADEVLCVHGFEHFYRWEVDALAAEWRRLLRPRGQLILEMPDLLKCCQNILSGTGGKHPDQLGMWGLYGDPRPQSPYMTHRWGWTPTTLGAFLQGAGFDQIASGTPQFHAAGRARRDLRMTARRP